MDLDVQVEKSDLVVGAIAVGAMSIRLLLEAPGIVVRKRFHELNQGSKNRSSSVRLRTNRVDTITRYETIRGSAKTR